MSGREPGLAALIEVGLPVAAGAAHVLLLRKGSTMATELDDLCQAWGCVRRAATASASEKVVGRLGALDAHFEQVSGLMPNRAAMSAPLSTESALLAADVYLRPHWASLPAEFHADWVDAMGAAFGRCIAINSNPRGASPRRNSGAALA